MIWWSQCSIFSSLIHTIFNKSQHFISLWSEQINVQVEKTHIGNIGETIEYSISVWEYRILAMFSWKTNRNENRHRRRSKVEPANIDQINYIFVFCCCNFCLCEVEFNRISAIFPSVSCFAQFLCVLSTVFYGILWIVSGTVKIPI